MKATVGIRLPTLLITDGKSSDCHAALRPNARSM